MNTTSMGGGYPAHYSRHALRFGKEAVGQAGNPRTLTVLNRGDQSVTLSKIATSGDFALGTGTCVQGGALASGSTCTIAVAFKPTSVGPRAGTLTIQDSGNPATKTVALEGVGTSVNGAAATLSALALEFDATAVGQATTKTLTISNPAGGAVLDINGITIEGRTATDYAATTTCTPQLAAGSSCTVNLTFDPAVVDPERDLLTIASDAKGVLETLLIGRAGVASTTTGSTSTTSTSGTTMAGGSSTGTSTTSGSTSTSTAASSSAPSVSASATQLVFAAGSASAQSLTLTNAGPGQFAVSGTSVTGADAADFSATNNCAAVAAGSPCTVNVMFNPTASGARSATLEIASNAAGSPLAIDLEAQATTSSGAAVTPSTPALSFAPVTMGATSGALEVMLTNTGTAPAPIGQLQVSGGSGFSITSDKCSGTTLAPAASCSVTVQFAPQTTGAQSGQLTTSTGSASAMKAVQLSGTALAPVSASAASTMPSTGGGGALGGWTLALGAALLASRRRRAGQAHPGLQQGVAKR
ncbi:MAG TPA: choice-of-anchor D domain-containing protein [Burkholderiaceae bacterium]|nr:choice-of-anchor D domain-containing protein [Burkholderiaceae bacterium]